MTCPIRLHSRRSWFAPRFGGVERDAAVSGGARGAFADVLWDTSVTAGANTADFLMRDTVNASLGPATTTFDVGLSILISP